MIPSPEFWKYISESTGLSPGAIDNVIGTLVGGALVSTGLYFRKSIQKFFRSVGSKPPVAPPTARAAELSAGVEASVPPTPPLCKHPAAVPLATPSHVPRPPTIDFVWRRNGEGGNLVELLKEELAPGRKRLLALHGGAGVGKTELAAEAARAWAETYGPRVVWLSAEGRADFTLDTLLDEITTQLGGAEQPGPPKSLGDLRPPAPARDKQVKALIAPAPTLVVLDNFETIENAERQRCETFLARAPCPALITTRLPVETAATVAVSDMLPDEAREFLSRLDRQTGGPPLTAERDQIIEVASANPLLMKLLVGQILSDPKQEPRAALSRLARARGDARGRIFERSYNHPLMSSHSRNVLLALSMFVPSASRQALEEVAKLNGKAARLDDAIRPLISLRLVRAEGGRVAIESATREFARARLERARPKADKLDRNFVAYYRRHAEAHDQVTAEDLDALAPEKDNLLRAMDAAGRLRDYRSVRKIADTIAPIGGLLDMRGYWDEAIKRNMQAREAAREERRDLEEALFSNRIGGIRQRLGKYEEAKASNELARDIYKRQMEAGNAAARRPYARAYHNLADIEYHLGNLAEAERLCRLSLGLTNEFGDHKGTAFNLQLLARIAYNKSELGKAQRFCAESLKIKKELQGETPGGEKVVAEALHELGIIAYARADYALARQHYEESLKIKERFGDRRGIACTLHNLAVVAHRQHDLERASELYRGSLAIARELNIRQGVAATLTGLGTIALRRGGLAEAGRLLQEALGIADDLGDQYSVACIRHQLGRVAEKRGEAAEAARLFRASGAAFAQLKSSKVWVARRSLWRSRASRVIVPLRFRTRRAAKTP